jgi:hypothetical protein
MIEMSSAKWLKVREDKDLVIEADPVVRSARIMPLGGHL